MKGIEFSFGDEMIPQQTILETAEKLKPEIRNIAKAISQGI